MQSLKRASIVATLVFLALFTMGNTSCSKTTSSRAENQRAQEEISMMATRAEPAYHPTNFLARHYVNEYMKRMDTPSKMFYVYLVNYQGQTMGYYTARSFPLSVCTLLTPPDREVATRGQGANPLGAAPSLEGTYQGGKCDNVFFFDAATNAYIELSDRQIYNVSDQPLIRGDGPTRHIVIDSPDNLQGNRVPAPSVD